MTNQELRDIAIRLKLDDNIPWTQMVDAFEQATGQKWGYDKLRGVVRRAPGYKETKGKIEFEDKKQEPSEMDIDQYFAALRHLDTTIGNLDTKQTKTTLTLRDDKPVGIAFFGDWHLGARGVDYAQFEQDVQTINDTDGLYMIGMGDYKDNQLAAVHPSGVTEQIANPGMQDLLVVNFIRKLSDKILALIRGCHDTWDKKVGDKDFVATLCSEAGCVNLWHGGGVNIKLGDQLYKIRARHKYKNESGLNTTNAQRNMLNDFGPADVIAVGHKHYPDIQKLKRMGQPVVYLRSGTYKVYDEYGQQLGGYKGEIGVPVVILYPGEHRMIAFEQLRDGIDFLRAVRA